MKKALKALWQGIKSIVGWVATLFGMKENTKYSRFLRHAVGTALVVLVIIWMMTGFMRFTDEFFDWDVRELFNKDDDYILDELSKDVYFYKDYYKYEGYIENAKGKKLIKHVVWVARPLEGDSLVCYSDGEHRGYFHLRDGRVVVPPTYDRAWIFSEGIAAVEKEGRIMFIDTTGRVVLDKNLCYSDETDGYIFRHGYCAMFDSTGRKAGLIDHEGNWVLPPQYESIVSVDTFWILRSEREQSIVTHGLQTVLPPMKASLSVDDTVIRATFQDHSMRVYDLNGKVVTANLISDVEKMMYETREVMYHYKSEADGYMEEVFVDQEPVIRKAMATCMKYEAEDGWYGLMGSNGKIVTPPLYYRIEAVGKDIYLCTSEYGRGVMLNSSGKLVE